MRLSSISGYWPGWHRSRVAAACLTLLLLSFSPGFGQENAALARPIVRRVAPAYSPMAQKYHLRGIVKLNVLVGSDGSVKSAEVSGGNPLLGEQARKAVEQWKWQPAPRATKEAVEIKFEAE